MSFNRKNCILYRKGEKEMCNYMIYCADKAAELGVMTKNEARLQINLWAEK